MEDEVYLDNLTAAFVQDGDCTQSDNEEQRIEVHLEDNGVGKFVWIKTDRWSFANADEFAKLVDKVREMEKAADGEDSDDGGEIQYIDLGLPSGTLWADRNIGAESPWNSGLYFQWGEIEGHNYSLGKPAIRSSWDTCPGNGGSIIPNETELDVWDSIVVNDKKLLSGEYDGVRSWTSEAHMPTKEQIQELIDNTEHRFVNKNGTNGMEFYSNVNCNSIFIPFVGYAFSHSFGCVGKGVMIWSSSAVEETVATSDDKKYCAHCLTILNNLPEAKACSVSYMSRIGACPLRGVKEKQ